VTIQLEDLGFCAKGEGGDLVGNTDLSHTGELPVNTGGGQLSMGQAGGAGGLIGTVEAIRQLRGEGGDRQVPDCDTALAASFGNVTYGVGMSSGVNIFSTEGAA
jgi:acetyl-CoA acetyltransferase